MEPTVRTTTPQRERVRCLRLTRWAALVCWFQVGNLACAEPAGGWLRWVWTDRRVVSWEV